MGIRADRETDTWTRGGCSAKKYIPLLGWQCETTTLSCTKYAKPYLCWQKILAKIHTLPGTNPQKGYPLWQKWCSKCSSTALKIQFSAIFDSLHSFWHNQCKNNTLSGTHLVFKTLPLVAHCLKTLYFVALKLAKMVPSPS